MYKGRPDRDEVLKAVTPLGTSTTYECESDSKGGRIR
jgi:hypothetical protein